MSHAIFLRGELSMPMFSYPFEALEVSKTDLPSGEIVVGREELLAIMRASTTCLSRCPGLP